MSLANRSLVVVLALTVPASPMVSLAQQPDTVQAPMTLLRHEPGEPSWAATFRLRDAEPRYAKHPQWGPT